MVARLLSLHVGNVSDIALLLYPGQNSVDNWTHGFLFQNLLRKVLGGSQKLCLISSNSILKSISMYFKSFSRRPHDYRGEGYRRDKNLLRLI